MFLQKEEGKTSSFFLEFILMTRFNFNAKTVEEAGEYFRNRAFQLLRDDFEWSGFVTPLIWNGVIWGAKTSFFDREHPEDKYVSIYVLEGHQNQGHMKRYLSTSEETFVTTDPCGVFDYLYQHAYEVYLTGDWLTLPGYRQIEKYYGSRKANRSGQYLMQHIDEGIAILHFLGEDSLGDAFAFHPLVQNDEDLKANFNSLIPEEEYDSTNPEALYPLNANDIPNPYDLLLAFEYRNIANQFLSKMEGHPGFKDASEIVLSPLTQVNTMLRADKIQNYKDFLLYHAKSHPRRDWLDKYFMQWFERLEISWEDFESYLRKLRVPGMTITDPQEV